jgi:hypothetical protein
MTAPNGPGQIPMNGASDPAYPPAAPHYRAKSQDASGVMHRSSDTFHRTDVSGVNLTPLTGFRRRWICGGRLRRGGRGQGGDDRFVTDSRHGFEQLRWAEECEENDE